MLAGCAPSIPATQLVGWSAAEVGDARLLGDVPAEDLQRLADDLAVFDAAFAHLAGWPAGATGTPVEVFVLRERELARRFGLGGGIVGWALPSLDGPRATVDAGRSYGEMRATLFHEYTHVLLRRGRRAPLPPWYDEGLASFFGTLDARDGAVVVGAPPGASVARVRGRDPLPLEDLFGGDVWERKAEGVADFYATSWALSHYLLLTPEGRREMSRLVEQLSRGASAREAQSAAFGRSFEALEAEVREHVSLLARGAPAEAVFDVEALDVRPAGRAAPIPRQEAAGRLGLLALELARREVESRDDAALAGVLLEMALARGASSARLEAALAEARAMAGRQDAAEASLASGLARAPDDPEVLLHAGRVSLALAERDDDDAASATALADAERHFHQATVLSPGSASAWYGLGRTLRRSARGDEALAAFREARRLGWSPELDLELGELELERGRTQQAVALLWPIVQSPHDDRIRDAARRALEDAGVIPGEAADGEGR